MSDGSRLAMAQEFLRRSGLEGAGDQADWEPLTGGVSSDLWRVRISGQTVCVKGALETLRVADEWHAPVSRNAAEYAWLAFVGRLFPDSVPRLLAHEPGSGFFAMEYLPPARYPSWKSELMAGRVDDDVAGSVGRLLGLVHRASTQEPGVAQEFAYDANFEALRLDPYLHVTAQRNPAVASRLEDLARRTANTRIALVHGDVSPKNILVGPEGPMFLDAECAWFGDPAFDVAFCLVHLALKARVRPERVAELQASAMALLAEYGKQVSWEEPARLDHRIATLLPVLLLARIDGASPVEYLDDADRIAVRCIALGMLAAPATCTRAVLEEWYDSLPAAVAPSAL